jgi:uncharacterized protein (DUF4415 family)
MNKNHQAVQYFSDEQLARSAEMSVEERMRFLDQYRQLHGARSASAQKQKSKLISLKVPEDLLESFRRQCEMEGVKYQTKIKELMREYLQNRE